jgi:2-methylisocitrate lyase-like PEP mutase family enzyme
MANMVEGGKTPLFSVRELEEMGFKLVVFSGSAQKIAILAMQELFDALKTTGKLDSVLDRIVSLGDRSRLLGLARFYEMEKKYGVP